MQRQHHFSKVQGLPMRVCYVMIDLDQAFQEVMSHLCFEVFLGLYGSRLNITDISPRKLDFTTLYNYCDNFFTRSTVEEALVNFYFFRFY